MDMQWLKWTIRGWGTVDSGLGLYLWFRVRCYSHGPHG